MVIDVALDSLEQMFNKLNQVQDSFGVLLNFNDVQDMSSDTLRRHCEEIEKTLTFLW